MEIETSTVQKRRSVPSIAMHKQSSRTLTKSKPKIRIIHIFAPEIIKTDVSNFRETVQNLTGKQDHHDHDDLPHQKSLKRNPRSRTSDDHHRQFHHMNNKRLRINSEVEGMESMTWNGNGTGENSGEFLNGLGDLDGFIQELGEFPYLPLTIDPSVASSSHLHGSVFAESHHYA